MVAWDEEMDATEGGGEEPERVCPDSVPSDSIHALINQGQLEHALAQADDFNSLLELNNKVAVAQELARRVHLALDEQNRLAETRIRAARKLGLILNELVHRGGRSKLRDVTSIRGGSSSPLPEGITKIQSFRFQQIANIREEDFERYVQETQEKQVSITAAGLLRAARRYAAGPGQAPSHGGTAEAYWEEVWDAVTRVMDLDFCVGISAKKLGAPKFLQPKAAMQSQLSGNVLVRASKEVGPWLEKLSQGRRLGRIAEAMILFVPHTGQTHFRLVESEGWTCCFLEKPEAVSNTHALVYHGERKHAFCLVFRELGAVLVTPEF